MTLYFSLCSVQKEAPLRRRRPQGTLCPLRLVSQRAGRRLGLGGRRKLARPGLKAIFWDTDVSNRSLVNGQ